MVAGEEEYAKASEEGDGDWEYAAQRDQTTAMNGRKWAQEEHYVKTNHQGCNHNADKVFLDVFDPGLHVALLCV